MFQYLFWIILVLLGLGAAAAALAIWDQVRDKLAAWLRSMGLHNSALMDAVVYFDTIAGKVRSRLFATTHQTGKVMIDETTYRMDQIDDSKVLAELRARGYAERSVLDLVN
jgi:NADH:ubiquinone oxidoreductase subunit 5 (subunit L)/multisubunit Na+/H+ antiporter MnhA subunit